jgi:hypothetical protein
VSTDATAHASRMGTVEILLNIVVAALVMAGMIWVLKKSHPHT